MHIRNKRATSPLHRTLRAHIEKLLADTAPGERLPTDRRLAARFGVSLPTVQRTMRLLRDEGLVARVPGRGSFAGRLPSRPGPLPAAPKESWQRVAGHFRELVSSGAIQTGTPFPSVKHSALQLGVTQATVIRAYRRLCGDGLAHRHGRAYVAGATGGTPDLLPRKHGVVFLPDNLSPAGLFRDDALSPEMVKMEHELHKNHFSVEFGPVTDFAVLLKQWHRRRRYPNGIVFVRCPFDTRSALREQVVSLRRRAGLSAPAVLLIGEGRDRPAAGIVRYHEANPMTQVCRRLAHFARHGGYRRLVAFVDRTRAGGTHGFGGMIKLRSEVVHVAAHCRFRFVVTTRRMRAGPGLADPFDSLPADKPIPQASKYVPTTRGDIERDIVPCREFAEVYANVAGGDLWVFAHDADAAAALDWAAGRGVDIPGTLSVVSLENDPAFLHRGITCCVRDWESAGYLLAHALLGDIPIARTRQGYVRTSALMLERRTTR